MPGNGKRSGGAKARKGGGGSKGGGGQTPLPEGVDKIEVGGGNVMYSFRAGDETIDFTVMDGNVNFSVGGEFDRGALQGRDADRAALTVMRIFKHDVSTRPDGYVYATSAWTGDNFGDRRVKAYERAGFSAPLGGAGGVQAGIVKGGKLTPTDPNSPAARDAYLGSLASLFDD